MDVPISGARQVRILPNFFTPLAPSHVIGWAPLSMLRRACHLWNMVSMTTASRQPFRKGTTKRFSSDNPSLHKVIFKSPSSGSSALHRILIEEKKLNYIHDGFWLCRFGVGVYHSECDWSPICFPHRFFLSFGGRGRTPRAP
ncbi:hypothetical protein NPIL_532821 [Nephila pilipes]|uniref:Uncharacterized protein n=1 Tax=Nephila pilipes TaxID=299642 RepID=A0A8X6TT42_NEPPI|nr:hypothetical protein NPIL_532821 [Nephila pilipes]